MNKFVIGLDCSTSAVKAIVWDSKGSPVSTGRSPLTILHPHPQWHEQSADSWWDCACSAIREALQTLDPAQITGLAISHQRETFVPIDAGGNPLRNGILWMDERATEQIDAFARAIAPGEFQEITGKPLSGNLSIIKMAWIKAHEPEVWSRAAEWLDVHAFLIYKLTGQLSTGWGCADPTGLFDINRNTWSEKICAAVGLPIDHLPKTYAPGEKIGEITSRAAELTGLPEGISVFAGLGDGQSAALGMNIIQTGDAAISLGTSVITSVFSPQKRVSRAFRTTCAGVPGTYLYEMVLLGGTYTVDWFLTNFAGARSIQEVEKAAQAIEPGAGGLMLVPYWNSVMNPYWDPSASGMIVGWRGFHTGDHLYRAILEGIGYEVRLELEGAEQALGSSVERLVVTGGGSKSALWREIIAQITGLPVYRSLTAESAALGAGILAAAGCGLYPDIQTAALAMSAQPADPVLPDSNTQALYDRLYREVYLSLYPNLKATFQHLASITQGNEKSAC
jgi:xylulokinase